MRVALRVEYDGTAFAGWERQRDQRTVQETLEAALTRVADAPVATVCAGRTDSGVHALGQLVHFDTEARRRPRAWTMGTNTSLPADVAVAWAGEVSGEFHARFSALRRRYRYVIFSSPVRSPLWRSRAAWTYRKLDPEAMRLAARHLVGRHDFSAYRAAGCQAKSPVRTVHRLAVEARGPWIHFDVVADAFLQHMVRNIAGVLMAVGAGEASPDWSLEVLQSRDRTRGGVTAAPEGLYLVDVDYPPEHGIDAVSPWQAVW